jgi:hypothetical protein
VIKLCEQAALRIDLVRLMKKYDAGKELRERMREKLKREYDSEKLSAEEQRRMPEFDLSDIHLGMQHTLGRMREGCQHLMHESMTDSLFDHIYAEEGCEHVLRRINGTPWLRHGSGSETWFGSFSTGLEQAAAKELIRQSDWGT